MRNLWERGHFGLMGKEKIAGQKDGEDYDVNKAGNRDLFKPMTGLRNHSDRKLLGPPGKDI